jgi:hypothetical protein
MLPAIITSRKGRTDAFSQSKVLDHAMAFRWVRVGCLGVNDDLAHAYTSTKCLSLWLLQGL